MALTLEQVAAVAERAGLSGDALATAAAVSGWAGSPTHGESGGDPNALGDVRLATSMWGPSVGLWQIRSLNSQLNTGETRDANALSNPEFNARSMAVISKGGTDWSPWSVYTTGSYRGNLDAARKGLGVKSGKSAVLVSSVIPIPGLGAVGDIGKVVGTVSDPMFWRRVGMGVLGAALLVVSFVIISGDSLGPVAVKAAVAV